MSHPRNIFLVLIHVAVVSMSFDWSHLTLERIAYCVPRGTFFVYWKLRKGKGSEVVLSKFILNVYSFAVVSIRRLLHEICILLSNISLRFVILIEALPDVSQLEVLHPLLFKTLYSLLLNALNLNNVIFIFLLSDSLQSLISIGHFVRSYRLSLASFFVKLNFSLARLALTAFLVSLFIVDVKSVAKSHLLPWVFLVQGCVAVIGMHIVYSDVKRDVVSCYWD